MSEQLPENRNYAWNKARLVMEYSLTVEQAEQLLDEIQQLIATALQNQREELAEEVNRFISEELIVSYPHPSKGWSDRIEMDAEDLCDKIEEHFLQESNHE